MSPVTSASISRVWFVSLVPFLSPTWAKLWFLQIVPYFVLELDVDAFRTTSGESASFRFTLKNPVSQKWLVYSLILMVPAAVLRTYDPMKSRQPITWSLVRSTLILCLTFPP